MYVWFHCSPITGSLMACSKDKNFMGNFISKNMKKKHFHAKFFVSDWKYACALCEPVLNPDSTLKHKFSNYIDLADIYNETQILELKDEKKEVAIDFTLRTLSLLNERT